MQNKSFDFLVIDLNASILEALKKMDEIQKKLLVVIKDNSFHSVLSIGDLQRAIINKFSLDEPIKNILRTEIVVGNNEESIDEIKAKMLSTRIEFMPIIDKDKNIINILFWEDVFGSTLQRKKVNLNLPVVIMAGGIGNRLKPLTNVLPKPLIPIGEQTIIEKIMNNFSEIGCNDFFISVNYKADLIKYYLQNLKNNVHNISYIQENSPLGTAGSLYLIKNKIHKTFFVSNCDILIDQDLNDVYQYHKKYDNDITIVSALKHYNIPYGTINTIEDGALSTLNEKPELVFQINTGVYILEPNVLSLIPENTFFHITELIQAVKKQGGKVGVFPIGEKSWTDIGSWDEYLKLIHKENSQII